MKEIQKQSSGAQHLTAINSPNNEEVIEKAFNEYEITKNQIREETEEWIQRMRYFVENFCKVRDSLKALLQKKRKLIDGVQQKHGLSNDKDIDKFCPEFLNNKSKNLSTSVNHLKTTLMEMNELVAKNWNNYLIAFESKNNSSNDLAIDLNQWFGGNKLYSFSCGAQEFIRRVKHYDTVLQNGNQLFVFVLNFHYFVCLLITVSDNTLEKFSNFSTKYSTELRNYKKHLIQMTSELKSVLDQLKCLTKTKRTQLLATPEIIKRRKWFAERIPDISKFKLKFEPKPRISKEKEIVLDVVSKVVPQTNETTDESPVFMSRPSLCEYSFQVMDISTCHYVAPTGCPLSMNDSHLFSPIENRTKNVFDSK